MIFAMKHLTAAQWKRVESLFHQTLELSPNERQKRLCEIKESDPLLAADLEKMVSAHQKSGAFLSGTVADDLSVANGERIGPWEIRKEIGRGGMSTVYLAERVDGRFERKVAIKFLHGLFPGKRMVERMKTEQNILAALDHENICGLLDAGVTENGRPYFIMEYVNGTPIDLYCERENLTVDQTLQLFEQVCEAVQHAHQRLIVHRDLKPGNILVNKEGKIKLLDFGISKIVSEEPELDITNTKTALHLMTPEYASPEQVRYKSVTTSADVYALGLVLCKLLTGELPYNVKQKSPLEIGNVILQAEPEKPSTLGNSGLTLLARKPELKKMLKGDLDNIILMALRKDPERRYSSVDQLLQDIKNYRTDRPVIGRPESFTYMAGKFIKRNRTVVAAASATVLVLIIAVVFSVWQAAIATEQRQIAEARLLDVRDLTGSLMFDIHDAIVPLSGSTPARELIAEKALEYLGELSEIEGDNPELNLELAASYRKIGDLLGNPTTSNLGRSREALESYELAENRLNRIGEENSSIRDLTRQKALLFEKKSDVLASVGNLEQSENYQRMSVQLFYDLMNESQDQQSEFSYAISMLKLGDLLGHPNFTNLQMPDSSLKYYREAESIFKTHAKQAPDDLRIIRYNGLIYERLGVIYDFLGHENEALQNLKVSASYRDQFIELDPINYNALRDRAISYEKMGEIYQKNGLLNEARRSFEKAFETYQWLRDSDPTNTSASQTLAISFLHLGDLAYHDELPSFGDRERSSYYFLQAKEILSQLIEKDSSNTRTAFLLGLVNGRLE